MMKQNGEVYEKWETERTHRIGLSVHEIQVLLDALEHSHVYPYTWTADYKRVDKRLKRLRDKVVDIHNGCGERGR